MFGVRKAPTGCNFVHSDEIWKDHVMRELQTSRKWPDTWGFLTSHYKKARSEISGASSQPQAVERSPPSVVVGSEPRRVYEMAGWSDHQSTHARTASRLHYPRTTAAEVGWMCGRRLEVFGRHARGQHGIRKLLNWPREAVF